MSRKVGEPSGIVKWGEAIGGWAAAECCVRPRTGNWVGKCSARIEPLPARIDARSIALASSRMFPGQS
jgi:hypothetical protein